jgi:putative ABC transport system permease protein
MGPIQTARLATRALLRNKLRSFLTALGIIIGVAAVIAMVASEKAPRARWKRRSRRWAPTC